MFFRVSKALYLFRYVFIRPGHKQDLFIIRSTLEHSGSEIRSLVAFARSFMSHR